MKRALILLLGFIFLNAAMAVAEMNRFETQRERKLREKREGRFSQSSATYPKIQESFLREDYSTTVRLSEEFLQKSPTDSRAAKVYHLQCLALLKVGRISEARQKLVLFETLYPHSLEKSRAAVSLADSYYVEGNRSVAYQKYEEASKKYSKDAEALYVSSRLHELAERMGNGVVLPPRPAMPAALRQLALEETPTYTVQVGAFARERNAAGLVNRLKRLSYDAYIEKDPDRNTHRVRVGRLASRTQAQDLESKLRREGYPTKIYP